ncbi:MAG: DnaJ domain-containing protein [Clostridiales bacterium]|jgi:molecular chaperone DnaJ|nr:DnaJ domain-containing protein [Clostridiales bacterium]
MDPYKVLGIRPGASSQEITKAYNEMISRYRSDRFADTVLQEAARQKLREIEQAYSILLGGDVNEISGQEKELPEERADVREENPYQQIRRLVQLGSLDQAEAALRRLETKTAQWHYLTGIILWKRGWYSEGRSHIQRAVDMAPWNREYSETLARIMKAYYPFPNLAGLSEGSVQCNCRTFLRCYDFLFKCICRDNSIDG